MKAAAAEIAPAVVEPTIDTVPDEPPAPKATPTQAPAVPAAPAAKATPAQAPAVPVPPDGDRTNQASTTGGHSPVSERPSPAQEQPAEKQASETQRIGATQEQPPKAQPARKQTTQTQPTREQATQEQQAQPGGEQPTETKPGAEQRVGEPAVPAAVERNPVVATVEAAVGRVVVRPEPWARLVADPGHAPELLAVAAVQSFGPVAAQWADGIRSAYPAADPDAVARLAVQRFTRFGTASSVFAAVAGSYAPVALLGAAAFAQAELALHVAAAYGIDPAGEERAADLLVLSRVHPSREDAVAALASAGEVSYDATGLTDAVWRLGRMLAAQAGGWSALRLVNRVFPGTSLLAAGLSSRAGVRAAAARATLYYRAQSRRTAA